MNNAYERMKSLYVKAGLSAADGGINNAEIYAYSVGMALVEAQLTAGLQALVPSAAVHRLAALYGLEEERFDEATLLSMIARRASYGFFPPDGADLQRELALCTDGDITVTEDGVILCGLTPENARAFSFFIHNFLPAGMAMAADGHGMRFDDWEATGYSFQQYDALGLPFCILDTLEVKE